MTRGYYTTFCSLRVFENGVLMKMFGGVLRKMFGGSAEENVWGGVLRKMFGAQGEELIGYWR
jgi:hypothetical protein